MMVNNSPNINKTKNNIYPYFIPHNTWRRKSMFMLWTYIYQFLIIFLILHSNCSIEHAHWCLLAKGSAEMQAVWIVFINARWKNALILDIGFFSDVRVKFRLCSLAFIYYNITNRHTTNKTENVLLIYSISSLFLRVVHILFILSLRMPYCSNSVFINLN